ncbi:MAG: DJ-1/PfpI family protein [Myxococcaceae bacterium]|nr:DJ-1/PfpI family protein [Myxococcaceae bacterium]
MNALMVIAPQNFRDEELFEPMAALQGAGHQVTLASAEPGPCRGALGGRAHATLGLDGARARDFDAVVFVGGGGARVFFDDRRALRLAREAHDAGKVVGAICIAPVILANAGVLAGSRATVFPTEGTALTHAGALLSFAEVMSDHDIVTANGPSAARAFGARLVELLAHRS